MRFSLLLVAVAAFLLLTGPVSVSRALADDAYACENELLLADVDARIAACTRAINSGRSHNLALLYENRGSAYQAKGDYERAIADNTEAIRLAPKDPSALIDRGVVYHDKGDNDRAIADYDRAIALGPKYVSEYGFTLAYYNRAIAYYAKGDNDHAIADYTRAMRLGVAMFLPDQYHNRGLAYAAKGDYDHAIVDYTEAIRLRPDAAFYRHRAMAYRSKGDLDRAIADYTEDIRLKTEDIRLKEAESDFGGLGLNVTMEDGLVKVVTPYADGPAAKAGVVANDIITNLDDEPVKGLTLTQAVEKMRGPVHSKIKLTILRNGVSKPIELTIEREMIHVQSNDGYASDLEERGEIYLAKHDYESAIADYNEAIRLDPKSAKAYNNRGNAYAAKGNNDRAIADYTEAIRLDPNKGGSAVIGGGFNNRGFAYYAKGDYDRAIADYDEAIRLDPKFALAYNNRGNAYYAKGEYNRAIADYDGAIRLDPKDSSAYFNRGRANLYAGALPKALADLNQASALDPKYAYAALWLDIVGQRNNIPSRLSQAISTIDMAAWPAPVIRMFLGQMTPAAVLAAADDPDATKQKGQVCEANFYSGEWALRTGAKDEAARLFRLAAADCPQDFVEWSAANAELKALVAAGR